MVNSSHCYSFLRLTYFFAGHNDINEFQKSWSRCKHPGFNVVYTTEAGHTFARLVQVQKSLIAYNGVYNCQFILQDSVPQVSSPVPWNLPVHVYEHVCGAEVTCFLCCLCTGFSDPDVQRWHNAHHSDSPRQGNIV